MTMMETLGLLDRTLYDIGESDMLDVWGDEDAAGGFSTVSLECEKGGGGGEGGREAIRAKPDFVYKRGSPFKESFSLSLYLACTHTAHGKRRRRRRRLLL